MFGKLKLLPWIFFTNHTFLETLIWFDSILTVRFYNTIVVYDVHKRQFCMLAIFFVLSQIAKESKISTNLSHL